MVVPLVANKRKEKLRKSFFRRAWPYLLGTCFIAAVLTTLAVALMTGFKIWRYMH